MKNAAQTGRANSPAAVDILTFPKIDTTKEDIPDLFKQPPSHSRENSATERYAPLSNEKRITPFKDGK